MIEGSHPHQQLTRRDIAERHVESIDVFDGSQLEESTMPMRRGFTTVMHYADPLLNAQDYHIEPLIL